MLGKISNEIFVPIRLPIAKCEAAYAMPSCVRENRIGTVNDFPSSIPKPTTKIDIFKPHWEKSLIESVNLIPCLALHRKARPRWLLNLLLILVVEIQAAVTHIPGVARPSAIYQ